MQSLVLLIWFTLCAEQDIRLRHVADSLTLGGGVCALLYLFTTGHTWLGALPAEGAWALALSMALTLPMHLMGRLAAADVKLLGTLALATDRMHLLATVCGALLLVLAWLMLGDRVWAQLSRKLKARLASLTPLQGQAPPLGPFLLAGFLATLLWLR
ncbi:A24 family peptidase [Pseudomonas typographi]|uniref:Prepilin peptidase n=1 Tax=Pseudomonas typographi TaxID=2715964 RepID=A0ABR7Z7I9_9PSED|nr:prepilin peptidase [Pseudomonas typographi]MBD1554353.1 prepilin peptidase [Pseudomonas typographi]MBD1589417.1 prepilin peptidase [Pseudomonas typographi]MBD1601504.1 prepilin peptidase [Pseudomonas typographi]